MTAPEEIHGVSYTQFSVARHFGGCRYAGHHYHYDAGRDVLIRGDVYSARLKAGKVEGKALAVAERERWMALQQPLI